MLSGAFIPEMQIFIGSGFSMSIDSVVHSMLLYISTPLKKGGFTCLPERSEKARFFASLRMTIKVKRFLTEYTSDAIP